MLSNDNIMCESSSSSSSIIISKRTCFEYILLLHIEIWCTVVQRLLDYELLSQGDIGEISVSWLIVSKMGLLMTNMGPMRSHEGRACPILPSSVHCHGSCGIKWGLGLPTIIWLGRKVWKRKICRKCFLIQAFSPSCHYWPMGLSRQRLTGDVAKKEKEGARGCDLGAPSMLDMLLLQVISTQAEAEISWHLQVLAWHFCLFVLVVMFPLVFHFQKILRAGVYRWFLGLIEMSLQSILGPIVWMFWSTQWRPDLELDI